MTTRVGERQRSNIQRLADKPRQIRQKRPEHVASVFVHLSQRKEPQT